MTAEQLKPVSERIHDAREARGWSQEDLAEAAGVSPNTVLSIEKGKRKPWPRNLRAVLDALDLAVFEEDAALDLVGVPGDVRAFLRVVAHRMSAMDEDARGRLLARLYPQIIESADHPAELIAAARREREIENAADRTESRQVSRNRP
jgi:transcriptional regulator with XRE-family HTH domain